jgi:hypothetical protein
MLLERGDAANGDSTRFVAVIHAHLGLPAGHVDAVESFKMHHMSNAFFIYTAGSA